MYGGLGSCLLLVIFSPVVSGAPTSIFPDASFDWFPLYNPGIVSIPLSFICGFPRHVAGQGRGGRSRQKEMEVRSLTGIGA